MSFGQQVISFYKQIEDFQDLPSPFQSIFPFRNPETQRVMGQFYHKYYDDSRARIFLYGINPGRFGAGITGISFTDPYVLERHCGISNAFDKRKELSSEFIYEVVNAYGGADEFYKNFFITSICPIGFLKDGKNANYYDDKGLEAHVHDQVMDWMKEQIDFGGTKKIAFSIGQGTNFKVLSRLNKTYGLFDDIRPLPHPRWVMQYRRKKKDIFVDQYCVELQKALDYVNE